MKETTMIVRRVVESFLKRIAYDFSSLQCNLPQDISQEIYQWGRDNISDDEVDSKEGRQPVDDIHVTLKYGLHNHDFTVARNLLQNMGPIDIELGSISIFECDDYDVVKIDVGSPDLHRINKLISSSLPVTDTHPEYIPHVTVSYVKKGVGQRLLGREDFKGRKIRFDSVMFSGHDNRRTSMPLSLR